MMRRARERREARERLCPCQQTCLCHQPAPMQWYDHPGAQLVILTSPFAIIVTMALLGPKPTPQRRYVRVHQQTCEVVFRKTGEECAAGMANHECRPVGYDEALCPPPRTP